MKPNKDDDYFIPIPLSYKRYIILILTFLFVIMGVSVFIQMRNDYNERPEIFEIVKEINIFSDPYNLDLNIISFNNSKSINEPKECFCQCQLFSDYVIDEWFHGMVKSWIGFLGFILIIKYILYLKKDFVKKLGGI